MTYTREEILEHRKQWVTALRDGTRRQTTGKLRSLDGAQCCLGVACEVAGVAPTLRGDGNRWLYDDSSAYLPRSVMEWLGVTSENPTANVTGLPTFADLNDDWHLSFTEIADAVENYGFSPDHDVLTQTNDDPTLEVAPVI